MKNTNELMNEFLSLDKNEHIPLKLSFGLLANKKCRTQVRLMTKAEKLAAQPLKIPMPLNDSSIENVLKQINPSLVEVKNKSPITLSRWIISGITMICLMLVFGFLTRNQSTQVLTFTFSLFFAGVVTSYCALFVGCNLDFFIKKIETTKIAL